MSFNYQNFATLGVNLNRQKYGPLDISNVFTSRADLNYYISKGAEKTSVSDYWLSIVPYPYAGQYVALVDSISRAVQPYILVEKEDGTFEAAEISGTDTNTTYALTVTEDAQEGVSGIKITFTPSDGAASEYFIEDPDLSDYLTSTDKETLESAISKKADAENVYTKEEADNKVAEAIAKAPHLKRVIVNNKEAIDINAEDALQYIYMVPSGITGDDNKYYEYIVIEEIVEEQTIRKLEKVGSWEVDLSEYAKITEVDEKIENLATKAELTEYKEAVNTTYATKTELETYKTSVSNDFATKTELETEKNTLNNSIATKVDKIEGSRLISSEEVDKLTNIEENAQVNYVKTVDSEFQVTSDEGKLSLVSVAQEKVNGLQKQTWTTNESGQLTSSSSVATLAEILVPATYIEEEGIGSGVSGLMTPAQVQKLNALVIGDNGNVEISGKVNASNVEGLDSYVNDTLGLSVLKTKVSTLESNTATLTEKASSLESKVANLETVASQHTSRLENIEQAIKWQTIE